MTKLKYFDINLNSVPARQHNKLGSVERNNSVPRFLTQCLVVDYKQKHSTREDQVSLYCIRSLSTCLLDIIFGCKLMGSFELLRRYTPAISDLSQLKHSVKLSTSTRSRLKLEHYAL